MASGVVHVPIYATIGRRDMLGDGMADMLGPASLKYGATRYSIQRSRDDRFNHRAMFWFDSKDDWYRFWEGEEAVEFRARYSGKFQVPITYVWHDEIGADATPAAVVEHTADVAIVS